MESNINCKFNLWKEKDQLIYKISNFSPDGTTRELSYFNNETPTGGSLQNQFKTTILIMNENNSSCTLIIGIHQMPSNPLQIISAKASLVYPGNVSKDVHLKKDDRLRFDGTRRNTWCAELHGSEALLKLDGLVEIIVRITVDTESIGASLSLPLDETPTPNKARHNICDNGQNSEVKIEVGGRVFSTDRSTLAASSPVFKKMLKKYTKESLENRIQINGVTAEAMCNLLQHISSNNCDYLKSGCINGLIDLYVLADRYLMEDVKAACVKRLVAQLTEDNATEMLEFGQFFNARRIIEAVKLFCWRNRSSIQKESSCVKTLLINCYHQLHCTPSNGCTFCRMD